MSLLSGYWLLFFHDTNKVIIIIHNSTVDAVVFTICFEPKYWYIVEKSSLLSNKKCYSLTWPDNKRNKGAKTSHCTTCSMALLINTIKGKCNHFSWNSLKKKVISELCKCEKLVPLLNHVGSVRWKKKAILWYPLKLDWISKQNQFARAILLPLVWSGMTSIFDKLLISGHGCWW